MEERGQSNSTGQHKLILQNRKKAAVRPEEPEDLDAYYEPGETGEDWQQPEETAGDWDPQIPDDGWKKP